LLALFEGFLDDLSSLLYRFLHSFKLLVVLFLLLGKFLTKFTREASVASALGYGDGAATDSEG
jgi:hypothetical protein